MLRVRQIDRRSLLTSKTRPSKTLGLVCATTSSNISADIKNSLRQRWCILAGDPHVGHLFKEPPVFAHKRAPNLRDQLVRADYFVRPQHFLSSLPQGNHPCRSCVHCNATIKGDSFSHPHSGRKYPIKSRISCKICCLSSKMPMWGVLCWQD